MRTVRDSLQGVTKLGIDTAPIIYFVEKHPIYIDRVREILRNVDGEKVQGYSSAITLTEVLALPKRLQNHQLVRMYRRYLLRSRNFALISITPEIADLAAGIRAAYGLHTPDALQIATVLSVGCEAFLTNDKSLIRVAELNIILVDDLTL